MHRIKNTALWLLGSLALLFTLSACQTMPDPYTPPSDPPPKVDDPNVRAMAYPAYEDNLIRITKDHISGAIVNGEFVYQIAVTAKHHLGTVEIEERLEDGITYLSSDPSGYPQGKKVSWSFPSMEKGETKNITVRVSPNAEGNFEMCTVLVEASPVICLPMFAGQPNLSIDKSGPPVLEIGDTATWTVVVTNNGTAKANDVVVRDVIPSGFEETTPISIDVGDLERGQSRTVKFKAVANEVGNFENVAVATYEGSDEEVSSNAPIRIVKSEVDIQKEGPAEEYVYTAQTYTVTVTNIGDTTLKQLVVTDGLPPAFKVVNAGTGQVAANTIKWNIPALDPGQSRSFDYVLTSNRPGTYDYPSQVVTARNLRDEDSISTDWLTAPAVQLYIIDDKDPIRVGDRTTYTARVTNQGNFKPVEADVRVVLTDNLKPISTSGSATSEIDGQTVVFSQAVIEPGKDLVLKIIAEAVQAGPGNARLEFNTEFLSQPAISDEPTNVY